MKKTLAFLSILLLLAVGCTQYPISTNSTGRNNTGTHNTSTTPATNSTADTVITYRTYGGFVMPEFAVQELKIEKGKAVLRIYSSNNTLTRESQMQINESEFNDLLKAFRENGFMQMNDTYRHATMVADVGTTEISLTENGKTKTVKLVEFPQEGTPVVPQGFIAIIDSIQPVLASVSSTTEADAKGIAEQWIKNAPTYKYDGESLQFVSAQALESFPPQYALTYRFTSLHGGYGNRTGEIVTQALTPHTIVVGVSDGEVRSAVIDSKWDEANQVMISQGAGNATSPNETVSGPVALKFQPMQCQQTPWQKYYSEGKLNFIKAPTEEEIALAYFSTRYNIQVSGFRKIESGLMTCEACDTCPTSYYYTLKTDSNGAEKLAQEGWSRI